MSRPLYLSKMFLVALYLLSVTSQDNNIDLSFRGTQQDGGIAGRYQDLSVQTNVSALAKKKENEQFRKGLEDKWNPEESRKIRKGNRANLEAQLLNMRKNLQKYHFSQSQKKEKSLKYQQFVESPEEAALIGQQNLQNKDFQKKKESPKRQVIQLDLIWTIFKPILISGLILFGILKLVNFLKKYNQQKKSSIHVVSEETESLKK